MEMSKVSNFPVEYMGKNTAVTVTVSTEVVYDKHYTTAPGVQIEFNGGKIAFTRREDYEKFLYIVNDAKSIFND